MSYDNFKVVIARGNPWFYRETAEKYSFETYEGPLVFSCQIYKAGKNPQGHECDADKCADFEANHKAGAVNIS